MKLTRLTAATAVASVLLLTGCSDDSSTPADGPSAASSDNAGATTDTSEEVASTSDTDVATDDAAVSTDMVDPKQAGHQGALSLEQATAVATGVLTSAEKVKETDGKWIAKSLDEAYTGHAKIAAKAADRLESVTGEPKASDPLTNPVEPNVLAVSREDGKNPTMILVQTVPKSGLPELHLIESPKGTEWGYRISWSSTMLPGTSLPPFDPRSEGTPVVRKGSGGLAEKPLAVLRDVATYVNYPQTTSTLPDVQTNGYAPAVRKAAKEQASAVSAQALLRETNYVHDRATRTLKFEDGSALVLGVLNRGTAFYVRSNSVLTPPDVYRVFNDVSEIKKKAVLHTRVFVAVHVGKKGDSSAPELIAAREQLVGASGR